MTFRRSLCGALALLLVTGCLSSGLYEPEIGARPIEDLYRGTQTLIAVWKTEEDRRVLFGETLGFGLVFWLVATPLAAVEETLLAPYVLTADALYEPPPPKPKARPRVEARPPAPPVDPRWVAARFPADEALWEETRGFGRASDESREAPPIQGVDPATSTGVLALLDRLLEGGRRGGHALAALRQRGPTKVAAALGPVAYLRLRALVAEGAPAPVREFGVRALAAVDGYEEERAAIFTRLLFSSGFDRFAKDVIARSLEDLRPAAAPWLAAVDSRAEAGQVSTTAAVRVMAASGAPSPIMVRRVARGYEIWPEEIREAVQMSGEPLVAVCAAVVEDGSESVETRRGALWCLGQLGGLARSALPVVRAAKRDSALSYRAVQALQRIGEAP